MFTNPYFASSVCNVDKKKLKTVAENIANVPLQQSPLFGQKPLLDRTADIELESKANFVKEH